MRSRLPLILSAVLVAASLNMCALNAKASGGWRPSDVALEATFLALLYLDYSSTRDILAGGGREKNFILGDNPSSQSLRNAAIAVAISHVIITHSVDREFRPAWLGLTIMIESFAVAHNKVQASVSLSF